MRLRYLYPLALIAALWGGLTSPAAAQDRVMMQGFYWDVQPGGVWYDSLATRASRLGWAGFDGIWLPPLSKGAASQWDVGYTPYDYYDLGGYDSCGGNATEGQGGCLPTRYGTEDALRQAIEILKSRGLNVYADIVLNHRSGGSLEPNQYGQWFTGGGSLYGENGQTYTAFPLVHGSGRIAWPVGAGNEFFFPNASNNPGNTGDFYSDTQLAGFHQMYVNGFGYDNALHNGFGDSLPLGDSLMVWGDWLTRELGLDGYRFDFVKGIHPNYLRRWVDHGAMRGRFHVHELYDGNIDRLATYYGQLSGSERPPAVFDFNMRFAYKDVLDHGQPIWRWHEAGLINRLGFPFEAIVPFVDNHDFDRLNYQGQVTIDGHSPVVNNKMLAYAHMLTHPGYAQVWWRDYYHYNLGARIDELVRIRKAFASGPYYALTRGATGSPFWPGANPPNPWEHLYVGQRNGDAQGRGLIVAINKHPSQWAEVWVTQQNGAWTNRTLRDLTGNAGGGTTQVFPDGRVRVWAPPNSYTVWVPTDYVLPPRGPMPAPDAFTYSTVHFGNLQWPATAEVVEGDPVTFYARSYAHGRTNGPGADPAVQVWIGHGAPGTNPATWTDWNEATFHADGGHLDEYAATLTLPVGTYAVASRIRLDGGDDVYGGYSDAGGGFWDGLRFTSASLTVAAPPTYMLSGAVTAGGGPLTGVTVSLSGDAPGAEVTDGFGVFSFTGLADGTYTLTPSLTGYDFAPASRAVTVAGEDLDGLDFEATLLPVQLGPISASASGPIPVGATVSFEASYTDLGGSGLSSATWTYGDGSDPAAGVVAGGALTGSHTFTAPGVYTVTLSAASASGATAQAEYQYVVVYDPSAGFVTGGGWIESPPGAYGPNPELTGKATFGFVARYRRGQSVPDGNTQFQFQAAGLSFRSTDYQWLVIAGPRAQFKGTGTVNGAGPYGFLVAAVDGDTSGAGSEDRFRIKIWAEGGAVVYDSQRGDADDAPASTALGGGSIQIHTGAQGGGSNKALVGEDDVPERLALEGAYPNPLREATAIQFAVPEAGPVLVAVYDALGREVARLADGEHPTGRHEVTLDASGLATGVYVVVLRAAGGHHSQRISVVR
jgi:hypothetical protein